jgi:hypothetical protein
MDLHNSRTSRELFKQSRVTQKTLDDSVELGASDSDLCRDSVLSGKELSPRAGVFHESQADGKIQGNTGGGL